jgi:hypothetical protein
VDQCIRKHSTTISRNLGLSSPNETLSGRDSRLSCSMHRIRSCAHTLRRDQESGMQAGDRNVEEAFQGLDSFICSLERGGEVDRGREDCKQAAQANRLTLVLGQKGGSRVWQP